MKLSAPTTITLRRPSADADHIISRHGDQDAVAKTTRDVTRREMSHSEPGSATASSPEDPHPAQVCVSACEDPDRF